MDKWKRFAIAIIEQACIDYAACVRELEKLQGMKKNEIVKGKINDNQREIERIENFIRSPAFQVYCEIDPERFIILLRKRGGKKNNKVIAVI